MSTGPVLRYFLIYPDQPQMERVSTLALGLVSKKWVLSAEEISNPVSIATSARVGEAGPWPKTKALSVSDQKYEAAISSDSFLCISAMDNLMHWARFLSPHRTFFGLLTLKNQSVHPTVGLGQEQKVSFHRSKEKFSALKGILLVSAFIRLDGSGSPSGPRHWRCGRSVGMTILLADS